jgi:anti-anti-sigma factor
LNAELTDAIQADDVTQICVDLSGVTFTDSTGVGSLIVGKQLATESGKLYEVVAADDLVRRVLDITGVWNYLSGQPD